MKRALYFFWASVLCLTTLVDAADGATYRFSSSKRALGELENPYVMLSNDGGGVRGIVEANFLFELEKALGFPLNEAFDCLVGTSTGGILTAGYATGHTAETMAAFYPENAPKIFSASLSHVVKTGAGLFGPRYDGVALKEIAEEIIGDLKISDCKTDVIITSYCLEHRRLHLFASDSFTEVVHDHLKGYADLSGGDTPLVMALRATAAAPVYFPSILLDDHNLIDGGMIYNDPAPLGSLQVLCSTDISQDRPLFVLSLGTGRHQIGPIPYSSSADWGLTQWIEPLIVTGFEANLLASNISMNMLAMDPRVNYMRYQVNLTPEQEAMDNTDPENMEALAELGRKAFQEALQNGFQENFIDPIKKLRQAALVSQ